METRYNEYVSRYITNQHTFDLWTSHSTAVVPGVDNLTFESQIWDSLVQRAALNRVLLPWLPLIFQHVLIRQDGDRSKCCGVLVSNPWVQWFFRSYYKNSVQLFSTIEIYSVWIIFSFLLVIIMMEIPLSRTWSLLPVNYFIFLTTAWTPSGGNGCSSYF